MSTISNQSMKHTVKLLKRKEMHALNLSPWNNSR
ncbi:hypothetical protein vBEcoMWL3_gp256 [Escherichia phage vB_EcoM_WL-3]|nr:hypothetical protein vBEcoMWL3_gp256 [Escherichia phage vB_EcoM_WL-3]